MKEKAFTFLICLSLAAVVPAISSADKQDMFGTHAFLYRYASWYALLYPDTVSIPPISFNDMQSTITAGAVTIGYDSKTQLVLTVNCDMLRNDEAFISQMVALVAAMSDDEAAALTFTEQQTAAWINVCTQAIQRGKNDPYRLGAYDLYILSSDNDVQLYAILSEEAQADLADRAPGISVSQLVVGETQEKVAAETAYTTLTIDDEGEKVLALKKRLYELGYFSSDNYSDSYNDVTVKRVSLFQLANGLDATGIATPATQALLFSANALKNPNPMDD